MTAHLMAKARAAAVTQAIVLVVVASIAISRTEHSAVTPGDLVRIVAGVTLASVLVAWVAGVHDGAHDRLTGAIDGAVEQGDDALASRPLWRSAAAWTAAACAWTTCGAIVLAAALDGAAATWIVVTVALVALSGSATVAVDVAARAAGARAAARFEAARPDPIDARRRAWLHLGVPMAVAQLLVNAGYAWLVFHEEAALTEADVVADTLIMVVLLTALFGYLAVQWGRLDAAVGRVIVDPEAVRGVSAKAPIGVQGFVYLAITALIAARVMSWLLPSAPSVLRAALVRGGFAAALVLVAVAFGHARGAVNGVAGATDVPALPTDRPLLSPDGRSGGRGLRRRLSPSAAAGAVAAIAVVLALPASRDSSIAVSFDDLLLSAETEAYAVRAEYDIPLPVGAGTLPHVVGEIRRVSGGENAKGLSASPSDLGAVVGGTYADPDKERKGDESRLPQAECFYPGDLVDTSFRFPTENRDETAALPATSYATAQCSAGPTLELHARSAAADSTTAGAIAPLASIASGTADALARPVDDVLRSRAEARATDVSLLGGLLTVDSVRAAGASSLTGQPGEAATDARIAVQGIAAGDVRFSLEDDQIVVGDQSMAMTSSGGRGVLDALEAALAPARCRVQALSDVDPYPQGFLFSRGEPTLGLRADGKAAGSMAGGLLLICDPPEALSAGTDFKPQRVQILLGFAFTSVSAVEDAGGFGLDDLGGDGTVTPPIALDDPAIVAPPASPPVTSDAPSDDEVAAPVAPDSPDRGPLSRILHFDGWIADTPALWGMALAAWVVLTHLGLARLRTAIAGGGS